MSRLEVFTPCARCDSRGAEGPEDPVWGPVCKRCAALPPGAPDPFPAADAGRPRFVYMKGAYNDPEPAVWPPGQKPSRS